MTGPPRSVADIFADACERPPAERPAFLAGACGDDAALRAEVESLLEAQEAAGRFFAGPLLQGGSRSLLERLAEREVGREIGAYRLTRWLASGGMAAVYEAERTDDVFRKKVAVKLLRADIARDELLARFRVERQLLADLEHPGIARLIDGGSTPEGLPYLVMEYVDGEPIDRYCARRALSLERRLRLFLGVCDAVQYAHHHLIIHRDLKPGNILIDASGRPRLLDFGIARVLESAAAPDDDAIWRTQAPALTPAYASPEQVQGHRMTTATDIYSLGVVLYELLTGRLPCDVAGRPAFEAGRVILAQVPPPAASVADDPRIARALRGDLDAVLAKALAKEPARRYSSVDEFAGDLRRHIEGLPVLARPDSAPERLRRLVARHRGIAATIAGAFVLMAVALGVALFASHEARRQEQEARWLTYTSSLSAAESSLLQNQAGEARQHLENAPPTLRGWEWRHLWARLDRSFSSWPAHANGITRLAFSGDGARLVTGSVDSTVSVWEAATGRRLRRHGPFGSTVESVAIDHDGTMVVAGLHNGAVLRCGPDSARVDTLLAPGWSYFALVAMTRDGRRVAAGLANGWVATWDEAGVPARWQAHEALAVTAWTPDGRRLVTAGGEGRVRVWDAATHALLREMSGDGRRIYTLDVNAERVAAGTTGGLAEVWELATGRLVSVFGGHASLVASLAFHPEGNRVVSSSTDGQVLIWDPTTGARLAALRGNTADVSAVAASPDGRCIAAGEWTGTLRLWRWTAADVPLLRLAEHPGGFGRLRAMALDPAGLRIAGATSESDTPLWDTGGATPLRTFATGALRRVAWAPDGRRLAGARDDGTLIVFDAETGDMVRTGERRVGALLALALNRAGDRVATAGADSTISVAAFPGLEPLRTFRTADVVLDVAFSPDGIRLAAPDGAGAVVVRDVADGAVSATLAVGPTPPLGLAFDPAGTTLAVASGDGLRVWDLARTPPTVGRWLTNPTTAVCFSPDGTRLVTGGGDQIIRVFSTAARRELVALHGHTGRILSLQFSRDGRRLVSASSDGTVRIWDAGEASRRAGPGGFTRSVAAHPLASPPASSR